MLIMSSQKTSHRVFYENSANVNLLHAVAVK